ncbi:MAG: 3-hydroxyacyl-CoA dehydrogenase family protein [Blastocatellales bacterium]|nr:3-hydroxyacyl-CoA dehydrogenase family protein [Blastocatellales bacterium]
MNHSVECIAVIGAGTMGHGIAQVAAQAGYEVYLHDVAEDLIARARARIEDNLSKGVTRGKVTEDERAAALSRLHTTTDLEQAAGRADMIIEAIVEDLGVKHDLFRRLEAAAPSHAVLASNTSSLSITEVAAAVGAPERIIGMHFFNPAHIMKLLEIIFTRQTSSDALEAAREVGRRMKKECITVRDSPGFATSRLGVCIGLEAIRMVEEGIASAEDIDKAMVLGYNHPMGPLRLGDLVGLDIRLGVAEYLHGKLGERFRPPELLRRMVADGRLGQKTGEGFYRWEK